VVDLLGRGGTLVNGRDVRAARLGDGDELGVGGYGLRVRLDAPSAVALGALGPATSALVRGSPATPAFGANAALPAEAEVLSPFGNWAAGPSPLVVQLAQFQQQMFEQFQETMTMMVQSLTAMHRDQVRVVQQEMDRVKQLSQELTSLHGQLATLPPPAPAPAAAPAPTPGPAVKEAAPTPAARPAASNAPPLPRPDPADRPNGTPGNQAVPEVRDWLLRRVAAVQQERKGAWTTIRRLLAGQPAAADPSRPPG
jgi:hypothetical protein